MGTKTLGQMGRDAIRLHLAGRQLYKTDQPPSGKLAFLLGVRQRQVQYWLSGQHPTPADVPNRLEAQVAAVEAFDLDGRLRALIAEAEAAGIDPQVTAHRMGLMKDEILRDREKSKD